MPFGSRTTRTLLALMLCIGGIGVIVLRAGRSSEPVVALPDSKSSISLQLARALENPVQEIPSTIADEPTRIQSIRALPPVPVVDVAIRQSPPIKPAAEQSPIDTVDTHAKAEPVSNHYVRTDQSELPLGPPLTPDGSSPENPGSFPVNEDDWFVVRDDSESSESRTRETKPLDRPTSRYLLPTTANNQSVMAAFVSTIPTPAILAAAIPAADPQPVSKNQTPASQSPDLARATNYQLAEQPRIGEHSPKSPPEIDCRATAVPPAQVEFQPDLEWSPTHDPSADMAIYNEKACQPTQRPAVELFRPWYQRGPIPENHSWFGFHNPDQFQFIVAGDQRTAYASNTQNGNSTSLIAAQLNLDFDLRLTSTERFHWFITPLTQGLNSTRWLLDDDRVVSELNADVLFGFFEGDLGAMTGGLTNKTLPFDLPFSVGVMPLVIQNGVWMDDTILGIATTMPAQNMPALNISNIDITFLFGMDQIDSPAFQNDNNAAKIYAIMAFIEAWDGYVEADYAYLEDRSSILDRSYHNISIGYTRRYGFISNSTRVIANAGQSNDGGPNTADGVLFLSENSLVTGSPYNRYPYLNLFAGFDRPQSAARQAAAGGVLRNTGILFESDNLTGYPTLDATANETFGMALGMNVMPSDFTHQLVLETAFLGTMGDDATRNAAGNQYGVGARYQIPISNHSLIRMDAMYGAFENSGDVHGARIEYRHKF